MINEYYFVITSLPALSLYEKNEWSFEKLEEFLKDNLSNKDLKKIEVLRRFYDILNIRAFLKKEPLDPFGNLTKNELDEALLGEPGFFPPYIMNFLEVYEKEKDRLFYFPKLVHDFYNREVVDLKGFLKNFLEFEKKYRLILTAYRAKKLGRDLTVELQFEDPEDPFILELLAQKDAKSFEMPTGFEELKSIVDEYFSNPLELHKALNQYRFNKILETTETIDPFSFDRILSYVAQFFIVSKWAALDQAQGNKIVEKIIKG